MGLGLGLGCRVGAVFVDVDVAGIGAVLVQLRICLGRSSMGSKRCRTSGSESWSWSGLCVSGCSGGGLNGAE